MRKLFKKILHYARVDVILPPNVQDSEVRPRAVGRTGPIWAGRQLGLTDQLLLAS
jgi:hypothetical protein